MHPAAQHPQDIPFLGHIHRLHTVHRVQQDMVQHQKFKIVPCIGEKLVLEMLHHGQQVEVFFGVPVVHR